MGGDDRSVEGAVDDLSPGLVDADDTADAALPFQVAGDGAVADEAPVVAHEATQGILEIRRGDADLYLQIFDHGGFLQVPEQAPVAAAAVERNAGDGVALAVEVAAEGRDGGKVGAGQVNVAGENDGLALGPAV